MYLYPVKIKKFDQVSYLLRPHAWTNHRCYKGPLYLGIPFQPSTRREGSNPAASRLPVKISHRLVSYKDQEEVSYKNL